MANRIKAIWLANHAANKGPHCFKILQAWRRSSIRVMPLSNKEFDTIAGRLTLTQCLELLKESTWGHNDFNIRLLLYLNNQKRNDWNAFLTQIGDEGSINDALNNLFNFELRAWDSEAYCKRIEELQDSRPIVYRRIKKLLLAPGAKIEDVYLKTLPVASWGGYVNNDTLFLNALQIFSVEEMGKLDNDQIYFILDNYRKRERFYLKSIFLVLLSRVNDLAAPQKQKFKDLFARTNRQVHGEHCDDPYKRAKWFCGEDCQQHIILLEKALGVT